MSDASMPNQETEPSQEVDASEQSQLHAPTNAGGSALLDANSAAGASTTPEGAAIANPIATNFSSGTKTGDTKTALASTVTELNSTQPEQPEQGSVHLQNNSDVPDRNAQGALPDTDPIKLPIDADVNLPE